MRWTEGRNLEEYLRLLGDGGVTLAHLAPERFRVDDATEAYEALSRDGDKPTLVLLEYDQRSEPATLAQTVRTASTREPNRGQIGVGLVGAGAFAEATHIPNLTRLRSDFELRAVMSRTGSTAKSLAARNEAAYATTDFDALLGDDDLDLDPDCHAT